MSYNIGINKQISYISMLIKQNLIIKSIIITALTFTAFLFFASSAFAATIEVTTDSGDINGSNGECSFLEAVENANSDLQIHTDCESGSGTDTIVFNIGLGATTDTQIISNSDYVISITSPIIISGLLQGDASCGTEEDLSDRDLDIELQGIGLLFQAGSGGSSVQGVSILGSQNFSAIALQNIEGFDLTCSNIGINAAGTSTVVDPINTVMLINNSNSVTIGSDSLELSATNLFSGANADFFSESILVFESNDLSIYGNWFGKGVGSSPNLFSAAQEYIEFCGPSTCGGDGTGGSSSTFILKGNNFTSGSTPNGVNLDSIDGLTLEDNNFEYFTDLSISINNSTEVGVTNNIMSGVDVRSSDSITINSNDIVSFSEEGIIVNESTDLEITNNTVSSTLFDGVRKIAVIIGNTVGVDISLNNLEGIKLDTSENITITSNTINNSPEEGIIVNESTTLEISNNTVSSAESAGVQIDNTAGVINIIDNVIINNNYGGLFVSETNTVSVLGNLLSGNGGPGLSLEAVTNATIQGNLIGTDETGMLADSNGKSVLLGREEPALSLSGVTGVVVGGDQESERNIISGNDHENSGGGIVIYPNRDTFEPSENITIQGNYIGVAADGVTTLINNGPGIFAFGGVTDTLIGGTSSGEGNIIVGGFSFSEEEFPTILLFSLRVPTALENISILGNSIYDTGRQSIGFMADTTGDFEPDFFNNTPNDAFDTDEGPNAGIDARNNLNHLLNYPEFTSYETNTTTTNIQYVLDVPAGDYRIEFFQNSVLTDYGEGETFLDYQDITHTGGGQETFTKTLDVTIGDYISATATERNQATTSTFGATSPFSAVATIAPIVEQVRRRSSSSTPESRAKAQQAFSDYYAEEDQQETTTPTPSNNSPQNILNSGQCSADQIISDNMKQGDADGTYSTYNNGNVTEVHLLQAHINRILAQEYNQAAGPVDGFFGPLTKRGVERLQAALNDILKPAPLLVIDGIVGPFTRSAVNGSCGPDGLSN